jgi:sodium transport system permease protein
MIQATLTVFVKEIVDALRDRRSLVAALLFSFLGPLAVGGALDAVARRGAESPAPELAVAGAERAPSLVAFLTIRGAVVIPAPADPEAAVRNGRIAVVLSVPEDYARDVRQGRPGKLELLYDSSRDRSRKPVDRARGLIAEYGAQVRTLRLLARGISPDVATPVSAEERDFATPRSRAALALAMLPIFLLAAAFVGGMNVAIDTTAGERERGSLGPLLLCPVSTQAMALGKGLAAAVFGLLAIALTLGVALAVLGAWPAAGIGRSPVLAPAQVPLLLAVLAPLAPLAGALQMLVATACRSFKEAQTYLSLLLLAPMLPGFVLAFYALEPPPALAAVPVLGQQVLLDLAMRGRPVAATLLEAAAVTAILAAGACVYATGRLLRSERIVLGR